MKWLLIFMSMTHGASVNPTTLGEYTSERSCLLSIGIIVGMLEAREEVKIEDMWIVPDRLKYGNYECVEVPK